MIMCVIMIFPSVSVQSDYNSNWSIRSVRTYLDGLVTRDALLFGHAQRDGLHRLTALLHAHEVLQPLQHPRLLRGQTGDGGGGGDVRRRAVGCTYREVIHSAPIGMLL